jgi:predicted flap endonuclease-1-like 5' DNA nuclease
MVAFSQPKIKNVSNSLVTNRLQNLERERKQLEAVLGQNPDWRAFLEAQRRRAAGLPGGVLSDAAATALANNQVVVRYLKVVEELKALNASLPVPSEAPSKPEPTPESERVAKQRTASIEPPTSPEPAPFRTRVSMKPPQPETKPSSAQAARPVMPRPGHTDDLTLIRRIDRALAAQLNDIGVWTFEAIANWDRHEVRRVRDELDLGKRIWRENWIEQAALQHMRLALPAPSKQLADDQRPKMMAGDVTAVPRQRIKVGRKPKRLPAPAARRFVYIRGVSDSTAEGMRSAGVKSLADIANWSRADVKWFQAILGEEARISRDQWIEQARLLSNGVWTRYALRVVGGETRQLVKQPAALVASPVAAGVPKKDLTENVKAAEPQHPATESVAVSGPPVREAPPVAKPREIVVTDAAAISTERFDPMRSLTTKIALGKLKRPPPDLGWQRRHPMHLERQRGVLLPVPQRGKSTANTRGVSAVSLMQALSDVGSDKKRIGEVRTKAKKPASAAGAVEPTPDEVQDANFEPGAGELSEQELSDLVAADDWNDADALVVRRVEDEPSVSPTPPPPFADDAASSLPNVPFEKSHANETPTDFAGANDQTEDQDDFSWGNEAEVTIVSRPRENKVADRDNMLPAAALAEKPAPSIPSARERIGQSPELIARRLQGAHDADDDLDADHAGYRDSVEEATVTIIRAEASETDAGSVVRTDIANDVGDKDESKRVRAVKKIGSKFLKALTGD